MKLKITLLAFWLVSLHVSAQNAQLRGRLHDAEGKPVAFANVTLFRTADSILVKVVPTDEAGDFKMHNLRSGDFFLKTTYVGLPELRRAGITLAEGQDLDLGTLVFAAPGSELQQVTVTALRPMLEVKPDRMVFNVQGTINATGSDALNLLRRAPAVLVDNQDNISVLGRSGVLVYVDGKRLPITGQDLSAYLQNLPAEQIDRMDIITSPGAKYDAQGNAGIIDIRLKRDKNLGANGSLSSTFSQGVYPRHNTNASGNYRNRRLNIFGTAGIGGRRGFNNMDFLSTQNQLSLDEIVRTRNEFTNRDFRLGADFFIQKKHTVGFLVSGGENPHDGTTLNRIIIAPEATPALVESILNANTTQQNRRKNHAANLNYRFDNRQGRTLNFDLDMAKFSSDLQRRQSNEYTDAAGNPQSAIFNTFDTPSDIGIYTAKVDFENKIWGGTLGLGSKISQVISKNDFLVFDDLNGQSTRDDRRSNLFDYDEKVYAAYVSFNRPLGKKWEISTGLRAEQTDVRGDLQVFLPELQKPPVELNYLRWFPSAGLTWQVSQQNSWALGYSRRINRPDYHVLNPFNNQLSQISFEKGNPNLQPEIVNNLELGYTLAYRYNFKLGYSLTTDQITRLIGPDTSDARANYISWENLARQRVVSFNVSAPFTLSKWWDMYLSLTGSHIDNQADYGDGAVVDLQAYSYNIFQQSTFKLPGGWRGEVSGWFSGPGIWGGVFLYETSWSLDLGLQKKFLRDALTLRLSANDVFYESGWDGVSVFNGLTSAGGGRWDSRRAAVSLSYNFGNQNVKSRRRTTGLEEEAKRVGGE